MTTTIRKMRVQLVTLDIETYLNPDKTMSIYCISFYDGNKCYSFYISDYKSTTDLVLNVLKKLLVKKNHSKNIYIHNSS